MANLQIEGRTRMWRYENCSINRVTAGQMLAAIKDSKLDGVLFCCNLRDYRHTAILVLSSRKHSCTHEVLVWDKQTTHPIKKTHLWEFWKAAAEPRTSKVQMRRIWNSARVGKPGLLERRKNRLRTWQRSVK